MTTQLVTADNFDAEVLKSDKPVLVDFYADWCGPCKALAPVLETIATEKASELKILKVDVDACKDLAQKYDVRAMPTLLLFKEGKVIGRLLGAKPRSALESWVATSITENKEMDMAAAASAEKKKQDEAINKVAVAITAKIRKPLIAFGATMNGLAIAAGCAAMTVSSPMMVGAGVIVAVLGVERLSLAIGSLSLSDAEFVDLAKKKTELKGHLGVLHKISMHPATLLVGGVSSVAVAVAIWPMGGFFVGAGSFALGVLGGLQALRGAVGRDPKSWIKSTKEAKDGQTGAKPTPAADLSPAPKLDSVSAGNDFNSTAVVKTATTTQPTQTPPPPAA